MYSAAGLRTARGHFVVLVFVFLSYFTHIIIKKKMFILFSRTPFIYWFFTTTILLHHRIKGQESSSLRECLGLASLDIRFDKIKTFFFDTSFEYLRLRDGTQNSQPIFYC